MKENEVKNALSTWPKLKNGPHPNAAKCPHRSQIVIETHQLKTETRRIERHIFRKKGIKQRRPNPQPRLPEIKASERYRPTRYRAAGDGCRIPAGRTPFTFSAPLVKQIPPAPPGRPPRHGPTRRLSSARFRSSPSLLFPGKHHCPLIGCFRR